MKADRQLIRAADSSRSSSIVLMIMEDFDTASLSSGKKVRFNANEEIFFIPNKWDRLSRKTAPGKDKLAKESGTTCKAKVSDSERRGKGKQRSKRVKKITKPTYAKTTTTRAPASPSSQVLELGSSVLSTETSRTKKESSKTSTLEKKSKKTEQEIKLKLSHRNHKELSQDDLVLPRINYNSDLRKTIEHAVVRHRPLLETGLRQHEESCDDSNYLSPRTRSYSDTNSSTNSSVLSDQDDTGFKDERVFVLPPEREPKFSELSRNVESWSPFSNGQSSENRSRHKMPTALVIPNSILY